MDISTTLDTFNDKVLAAVGSLSIIGVDEAAVAAKLVEKYGPDEAYLIFFAAKVYLGV